MTSIQTSTILLITRLAISLAPESQQRNSIGYKFDSSTESTVCINLEFTCYSEFRTRMRSKTFTALNFTSGALVWQFWKKHRGAENLVPVDLFKEKKLSCFSPLRFGNKAKVRFKSVLFLSYEVFPKRLFCSTWKDQESTSPLTE